MIALNLEMISLFCLPHLVEVSGLIILSACFALMTVRFMCYKNVSFVSKVISRFFGCFIVGSA